MSDRLSLFTNVRTSPTFAEDSVMVNASTTGSMSLATARVKLDAGTLTAPELAANCEGLLAQLEAEIAAEDRTICENLAKAGQPKSRLSADQVKAAARGRLMGFASPGEQAALAAVIYGRK